MQMARLFWWLWHRSSNRICKQIAKTGPSCFGKTMLEKTGLFVVRQWAAWASAEIFPGGGEYRHFAYRFTDKWTFIESFTHPIPQTIPQESTCAIRIQVVAYASLLPAKGYTFCHPLQLLLNWHIIQYRYHCELQTTEYEVTWNIQNYACVAVISRYAGAAAGQGMQ